MLLHLNQVRYAFIAFFTSLVFLVSAADFGQPHDVRVRLVHTAEDIVSRMPAGGQFALSVQFAHEVDPIERTEIINQALRHERAFGIVALDLSENQLILPPVVTGLLNLQRLNLSVNQLRRSPVLTGLIHLRELDLTGNQLRQSPVLIGLTHLHTLDLTGNEIIQPPVLTGLAHLQKLTLSCNRLRQPPVLAGLVNLQELALSENQLIQPPVLTGLIHLNELYLSQNRLTYPPVLTGLPELEVLLLRRNPLQQPVRIPRALFDRLHHDLDEASYVLTDDEAALGAATNLVDIATPGVDTVPFFLVQETLSALPVPKINPSTRRQILQSMNLAESWRYWRDHGVREADFDARLRELEPVAYEANLYTVERQVARDFMRDRGFDESAITAIFRTFSDENVNVTALLDAMAERRQTDSRQPAPKRLQF